MGRGVLALKLIIAGDGEQESERGGKEREKEREI